VKKINNFVMEKLPAQCLHCGEYHAPGDACVSMSSLDAIRNGPMHKLIRSVAAGEKNKNPPQSDLETRPQVVEIEHIYQVYLATGQEVSDLMDNVQYAFEPENKFFIPIHQDSKKPFVFIIFPNGHCSKITKFPNNKERIDEFNQDDLRIVENKNFVYVNQVPRSHIVKITGDESIENLAGRFFIPIDVGDIRSVSFYRMFTPSRPTNADGSTEPQVSCQKYTIEVGTDEKNIKLFDAKNLKIIS
jgi:hypothetical protein